MLLLRQSTATTIQMGPALDKDDGVTAETGLSPSVFVSKAGAAQAARSSGGSITHDRDGYYRVPLDATDTGTLGMAMFQFTGAATHLPVVRAGWVIHQDLYDLIFSGNGFVVGLLTLANQIEGFSLEQTLKILLADASGESTGMETGEGIQIRAGGEGPTGPVRITADGDEWGNRSNVVLTPDAT